VGPTDSMVDLKKKMNERCTSNRSFLKIKKKKKKKKREFNFEIHYIWIVIIYETNCKPQVVYVIKI
jgi:hypothetical protein